MRKFILIFTIFCIVASFIVGCSNDNKNGSYYPSCSEMQKNLVELNYEVSVENFSDDNCFGTHLYATNNNEYIDFYWLDDDISVDEISEELERKHTNYDKFVSIKDDSEFGNRIFCGTELAIDDAGVEIVDVKVKV